MNVWVPKMLKRPDPKQINRILIIRLSALGDVILSTLLIRNLKKQFPGAHMDFCTKDIYKTLMAANPYIDRIFSLSSGKDKTRQKQILSLIREQSYDLVIDLQGNFRSIVLSFFSKSKYKIRASMMRWRRFFLVRFGWNFYHGICPVPLRFLHTMRAWGVDDDGAGLDLWIDKKSENSVQFKLTNHGVDLKNPRIVLAPGAGRATKRWTLEGYIDVAKYFESKGYDVVLIGDKNDMSISQQILKSVNFSLLNLTGQLALPETAAILKRSQLLIANDTGVMHMAAALGVKLIALFGPTTEELGFFPFRANSMVIEKNLLCRPCSFHGAESCPKGHFQCMLQISSSEVIDAAEHVLSRES